MERAVSGGVRAIKMQIGGAPISEDVERVRAARDAVGPDVKLMLDASSSYYHHEAITIAGELEAYDIFWLEEPVAPHDIRGYQMVAGATSIPIATGESEYDRYGFRDLIENRCASILQPDATLMGGVTEFMKVAALAQANDLPLSNHGPHNIHIHLLAAVPNGLIIEEYFTNDTVPIDGGVFVDPPAMEDGHIRAPDRPGLGLELNEAAVAPYRTG
jgi:L-alanine-DL-glutamate epimerase-like enolase superfamily enzyme